MSEYRRCRECGTDLGSDGRLFGIYECCCDQGYCTACCMDGADASTTSDVGPLSRDGRGAADGDG